MRDPQEKLHIVELEYTQDDIDGGYALPGIITKSGKTFTYTPINIKLYFNFKNHNLMIVVFLWFKLKN